MSQEIVAVAKREKNPKRNYLVLNRLQAKHVPGSPRTALAYFGCLADVVGRAYAGEKLLLIGFAETATGIGSALAIKLKTAYMQTTREEVEGAEFLYFTEAHSHATEQRLVRADLERALDKIDRIVFVEDELTTGNTVSHIVSLIRKTFLKRVNFAAASLVNGMSEEAKENFVKEGIDLCFLEAVDYSDFPKKAEQARVDGEYFPAHTGESSEGICCWEALGGQNARRLVNGEDYGHSCEDLWKQFLEANGRICGKRFLVLGTEELMYPALYLGSRLEEENQVLCHGTTRSPILVSRAPEDLLHRRFSLVSLYERERRTFVYNLEACDQAIVITDAPSPCREGLNSLFWALKRCGSRKIQLVRWC